MINIDNCDDFKSFEMKLEQEELLIKDEPGEVMEETITSKMNEYLHAILQIKPEPDHIVQESFTSDCDQGTCKSTINIDNFDDFKSFEMKLEQEELLIKDEPDEVMEETSTLQLDNVRTCYVKIIKLSEKINEYLHSILQIKPEPDHIVQESFSSDCDQDTCKSTINIDNCDDFKSFEMKLEQEELIMKDEPDEVMEEASTLELDNVRTCYVKVIKLPESAITSKMNEYLHSLSQSKPETEDHIVHESFTSDCNQGTCKSTINLSNEVTEPTSTLEIIIYETNPPTQKKSIESSAIKKRTYSHKVQKFLICNISKKTYRPNGKKYFQCSECEKGFALQRSYNRHISSHYSIKPCKCNICGKGFSQNQYLKAHLLSHTGEKPFECHVCDKAFAGRGSLKSHILSHTGEKPFKCNVCE